MYNINLPFLLYFFQGLLSVHSFLEYLFLLCLIDFPIFAIESIFRDIVLLVDPVIMTYYYASQNK